MVMDITWRPVRVGVGSLVEEGRMVLVNGTLVALLVHLTGPYDTPELHGKWFVEAGFGPHSDKQELFSTLEEAEDWVLQHYLAERKQGSGRTLLL
jgi:hypothetical protein